MGVAALDAQGWGFGARAQPRAVRVWITRRQGRQRWAAAVSSDAAPGDAMRCRCSPRPRGRHVKRLDGWTVLDAVVRTDAMGLARLRAKWKAVWSRMKAGSSAASPATVAQPLPPAADMEARSWPSTRAWHSIAAGHDQLHAGDTAAVLPSDRCSGQALEAASSTDALPRLRATIRQRDKRAPGRFSD
jgi:hypothetical protein